jgi:hypothetical protein
MMVNNWTQLILFTHHNTPIVISSNVAINYCHCFPLLLTSFGSKEFDHLLKSQHPSDSTFSHLDM